MSKVEEFYRALVKDPELEVKTGQSREQAARQEAEYRARQYNNNAEALSLATKPPESAINSLLDHVQVNKSYKNTALLKFVGKLFGGKKEEPKKDPISRMYDTVKAAMEDTEEGNTTRDAEYYKHFQTLTSDMTDTQKILQRSKDRKAEILEHPEFKAYNNMSKRLFALATDNGNRPFNTETVKDAIKKLTPEEKKIREKANNWSNPLKKDSFLHNFEWGKDADKLKRMSESGRAAVLNPLDLARHFDKKIDLTQNKLSHVATLRRSLSKTGPIKRHQKTLDDAKAAQVKKVQNDKSVDEADKKSLENFNKVTNESPTKKVNNSATQNKSTKPNEGDSGPTVSENLEAKEKRQQDLVNHRDIISDALDQHVAKRPERMTTQPDIDETKVDKDGLPIIPDEEKESDEAYNARCTSLANTYG